jgi:hypothetical protein
MEDNATRFKKVAVRRTNVILKQLRLLSNCANKHNYSYSDADVDKIFKAIEEQLKETKSEFAKGNKKGTFSL